MSIIFKTTSYFIPILLAFFLHQNQSIQPFIPQVIAFISLLIILSLIFSNRLILPLVFLILNLIVFSTGGINSFLFFLIYFLLFSLSLQNHPTTNLIYSLITIIFYSYSLNSLSSLIQLFSILLITPLTFLISQQQEQHEKTQANLSQDETDFLLWISLRLKSSLKQIISISDNPKIDKIVRNILKDSEKLEKTIDQNTDEN